MEQLSEIAMHHPLEERRRIFKAEVYYLKNECFMLCLEGSLVLVLFCNPNIVIAPLDIKLGKECLVPQIF